MHEVSVFVCVRAQVQHTEPEAVGARSEVTLHHFAIPVELRAIVGAVSGGAIVVPATEVDCELVAVQLAGSRIGAHLGG